MKTTRRGRGSRRAARRRAISMHHRGPGGVVVGAVVDVAGEEGQRARHQSAPAQVVVMAADDDGLLGQRAGALEHADHVLGLDRRPIDRQLRGQQDALQKPRTRLQVAVDLLLQLGQARLARGSEDLVGEVAAHHHEGELR